jgi:Uri superfamily endonuclease
MKGPAGLADEPAAARLYVVAAWVPAADRVVGGALGELQLQRGWHVYVGSARRARVARVARHLRSGKSLRWHADYLFSRYPASLAWLVDGRPGATECELAAALAAAPGGSRDHRRFGASDCGCPGHLLRFGSRVELGGALAEAERRGLRVGPYRGQTSQGPTGGTHPTEMVPTTGRPRGRGRKAVSPGGRRR